MAAELSGHSTGIFVVTTDASASTTIVMEEKENLQVVLFFFFSPTRSLPRAKVRYRNIKHILQRRKQLSGNHRRHLLLYGGSFKNISPRHCGQARHVRILRVPEGTVSIWNSAEVNGKQITRGTPALKNGL